MTIESQELLEIARRLLGQPVDSIVAVKGGGNNRLYRVDSTQGESFALKFYLRQPDDSRDRLGVESQALLFLQGHGVREVPRLLARDEGLGCALLEWIEGERVIQPTDQEREALLTLVNRLHQLGGLPEAQSLPLASAACLSGAMVASQVQHRMTRLEAVLPDYPQLDGFFKLVFVPAWQQILERIHKFYQQSGWDFTGLLPQEKHLLNPSDFGFHNALRTPDRGLVFVDFEYFGWDDPVKLVSDICWHPGMDGVTWGQKRDFANGVARIVADSDATFGARLEQLLPLFGLNWCLIILNEFLPSVWQRRVYASQSNDLQTVQAALPSVWQRRVFASQSNDLQTVQAAQLVKARRLMDSLQTIPAGWMS